MWKFELIRGGGDGKLKINTWSLIAGDGESERDEPDSRQPRLWQGEQDLCVGTPRVPDILSFIRYQIIVYN